VRARAARSAAVSPGRAPNITTPSRRSTTSAGWCWRSPTATVSPRSSIVCCTRKTHVKTELVVHFLKLDIESRSFDLVPGMQRLFASNDLPSRFPAQARQLRILLERADSPFTLPIPAMRDGAFAETHLGLGPCYYAAGRFYSQNRGHLWHDMDYAFDSDTLRANLGGHYVQSPQSVITYVLRPILKGLLMPFYRLASVHAAGLAAGERTLLLAGAPAAGQATGALA